MAIKSAIVSEYWQPPENSREMWEYGGQIYSLGVYRQGTEQPALGMFRTLGSDRGEVKMSNGGTAWEEVDIPGSPRKAWSMAFGQSPNDLLNYVADRFGDVVYFAAQCLAGSDIAIQVGSFDLVTGEWGAQGTDDASNPLASSPTSLIVTDMKCFDVDSYLILYHENLTTVETIKIVQYVAGTWGTPLTVQACDSTTYNALFTFPRLAHEQGSDYAHLAWIQENGASLTPPPNEAIYELTVSTYTISAGTASTPSAIDTFTSGFHNGSIRPWDLSYFHNFSGDSFLSYFWKFGTGATDYEYRYLQAVPSDSATPTWNTGLLCDDLYQYDVNNRFVTVGGELRYVHAIGQDSSGGAGYTDIDPQIAYRAWSGSAWATSDTLLYAIATGVNWISGRTTNELPLPDSLTHENYSPGGDPLSLHAIGTTSGLDGDNWAMPVLASSAGGSAGIAALFPAFWQRSGGASAVATYFARADTPASVGVRY